MNFRDLLVNSFLLYEYSRVDCLVVTGVIMFGMTLIDTSKRSGHRQSVEQGTHSLLPKGRVKATRRLQLIVFAFASRFGKQPLPILGGSS